MRSKLSPSRSSRSSKVIGWCAEMSIPISSMAATARGLEVDIHLALEPLHQELGAFGVERSPTHVERLDALGSGGADRRVIAVADHEVVLHDPPQRRKREEVRHHRRIVGAPDVED